MTTKNVGIFFGSRSAEHDVSIVTALAAVIRPLELSQQYKAVPVYIAKDGRCFSDDKLKDIHFFTSGQIGDWLQRAKPLTFGLDTGLQLIQPGFGNKKIQIDIAFPALHGTHGEDGEIMGLFELAGIPYVGCGVTASAVAMDKVLTKQVCAQSDIAVPKYVHFRKHQYEDAPSAQRTIINEALSYPLFVKPAHLGSSIGISRITKKSELANAIEVALHYDDRAVVEEAVPNLIEVTLPIMGNRVLQTAVLERPLTSANDFFDFETKYMRGGKKSGSKSSQGYSQIPADIPTEIADQAIAMAQRVYVALGCSGLARVDMLIDGKTKQVYCNEVNPLPGSLYNHNWNQAGISNLELVERLLTLALERQADQKMLTTNFNTSFLQQF